MTEPTPAARPGGTALAFVRSHWLALTLLVVAIVFILQNRSSTRIDFLFLSLTAPLWLTLTVTLLAGGAIGWGLGRRRQNSA